MNVLKNDVSGCASAALGGEGRPKRNVTVSYDYQCTEDFDTSADSDSDYIPQSSDDDLTEHNDDTGDNDFDEDVDDYVQDDVNDYVQDDVDDYVQDDVDDYVQDDVDGGLDRGVGGSKSTKSQKKESNKIETTNNKECPHIDEAYRRQMRNVSLPTYSKKEDGHRDYRKTNYCYYCKRSFTSKIAPHYISIHSDEELVKKIILSSTESEQRKTLLLELENKGNFAHNAQVIERGEGELVVARRPNSKQKEKYSSADYLPCEYCLGFYNKDTLWLHVNNCCLKPKNKQPSTKNFRRDAKAMLFPFMKDIDEDDALLESFFDGMKETNANPGVPLLCKNDPLIREFASSKLCRLGEKKEQRVKDVDNVRTKVRTVGRLLKQLHQNNEAKSPLSEFITGMNFMKVLNATKNISLESDSPQLALTIGHYIKHIALLKSSIGVQTEDEQMIKEARHFTELYNAHWNDRVSCVAKRRQQMRHINKPTKVPLTSDLIKLKDWLLQQLRNVIKVENPTRVLWEKAANMAMVRIAMFNKRRIAEVSEMKVTDFTEMEAQDDIDSEIYNALDMSEKILSKRMKVIEVRGKSTRSLRKVCVLLTPDMIDAVRYLLKTRNSSSEFLFSRQSDNTPLDGCTAMRTITKACPGLQQPGLIRTREMRRYLATTAQILDMTGAELKMVADHMGHNINIHTDVYRLQSSILEKTKVARVLIATENGSISRYQGKNLQEISLEDIAEPVSFEDSWSEGATGTGTGTDAAVTLSGDESDDEIELPLSEHSDENKAISCSPTSLMSKVQHLKGKQVTARSGRGMKRKWNGEENDFFLNFFKEEITQNKMPTGEKIVKAQKKLNRTVAQIRTRVHNIIHGKQKVA
ncbi:uncharacterized protein LOC127865682 [Dreissena polymorpha]|nr:uncharacterized protein LOC127865682 [Dreissena polymorpha]